MALDFYHNKKILITGHTGFKGSWLCHILLGAGADVTGYALEPPTEPNLFSIAGLGGRMNSVIGDVRDYGHLAKVFAEKKPEIVFHLAAQPLVRASYQDPRTTYETNVMGTVNVCECVRNSDSVKSFLNVTTDKVYHNSEWEWGYRETDPLDGFDPYSNSKSCSELVTHSYINSFFKNMGIATSTARAGNVIGGGDFSADRIIPDCIRAAFEGREIIVRNPDSTRPYQYVLEPLFAYLLIAERQYEDASLAGFYNVGPDDSDCVTTGNLADIFCASWGDGAKWVSQSDGGPHEASFLKLDCSRIKSILGWRPTWDVRRAVAETVAWTKCYLAGENVCACMDGEMGEFLGESVFPS